MPSSYRSFGIYLLSLYRYFLHLSVQFEKNLLSYDDCDSRLLLFFYPSSIDATRKGGIASCDWQSNFSGFYIAIWMFS